MDFLKRFWSRVAISDGCWEWTRGFDTHGYGVLGCRRKLMGAHRVAWELANAREVPAGMHVCHTCDNRKCVNPAHLWLGTNAENTRDKTLKGRARNGVLLGEASPCSKLRAADVIEIRRLCDAGQTQRSVAKLFGVSPPHVSEIVQRKRWAHL